MQMFKKFLEESQESLRDLKIPVSYGKKSISTAPFTFKQVNNFLGIRGVISPRLDDNRIVVTLNQNAPSDSKVIAAFKKRAKLTNDLAKFADFVQQSKAKNRIGDIDSVYYDLDDERITIVKKDVYGVNEDNMGAFTYQIREFIKKSKVIKDFDIVGIHTTFGGVRSINISTLWSLTDLKF